MMSYPGPALRSGGFESLDGACVETEDAFVKIAKRITLCQTQNQINRLHIDLENILAPLELAGLAKFAAVRDLLKPTRDWLRKFETLVPEILESPQQFGRHTLGPLTLYQNAEHDVMAKGLLVAFCGNARRLMVPVSIFLQFVDSRLWDVAVLKKSPRNTYLEGLDVATGFLGLIDHVEAVSSASSYRRKITLGTSGGGFAAACAALIMGADRGISIGGTMPRARASACDAIRDAHDERPAKAKNTELSFVFGAGCGRDQRSAAALLEIFGGGLQAVEGIDEHNVLGGLLKRGELAPFLQELLA